MISLRLTKLPTWTNKTLSFACSVNLLLVTFSQCCIDGQTGLAVLCFYSKTGFWPSYCQISTDLLQHYEVNHWLLITINLHSVRVALVNLQRRRLTPSWAYRRWSPLEILCLPATGFTILMILCLFDGFRKHPEFDNTRLLVDVVWKL